MRSPVLAVLALAVVGLSAAGPLNQGGYSGSSASGYQAGSGSSGSSDAYGKSDPSNCTPYSDTVVKDRCESYTERQCTTTQVENCVDVPDQTCSPVVSEQETRQCFDVTEQVCSLKEDVAYDSVDVPYVVQKCSKTPERVCDTNYVPVTKRASDSGCTDVTNSECSSTQNVLYDEVCKTTVTFDCDTSVDGGYDASSGNGASAGGYGSGSSGSGASSYGSGSSGYGSSGASSSGGAASGYGSSGSSSGSSSYGGAAQGYSSTSGYGKQEPNCRRTPETKCYKTPRPVNGFNCAKKSEHVCKTWDIDAPAVDQQQNCHDEDKKVCELEQRSQPKQVKKFTYSTQCRPVPKQVCATGKTKKLTQQCQPTTRRQCSYSPVEKCQDVPKQYCYKYSYQVQKQKCSDSAYPAASSTGYQQQQQGSSGTKY